VITGAPQSDEDAQEGMPAVSRYVALLRGVNVGGQRRIAMADLRAVLAGMGYTTVSTYLNSGNAVFTGGERLTAGMAPAIEDRLAAELGVNVRVVVRSSAQLDGVLARNPLSGPPANPSRFFVAFLSATAGQPAADEIGAWAAGDDRLWVSGAEAFLWCPKGFSVLGLTRMMEERLGVSATVRNWNTVTRLARLSSMPAAGPRSGGEPGQG
jgi:uncharacterized protein (DUF1697 family)